MTEIKELYDVFLSSEGVSTDSRENVEGKLFFALSGENFDGNRFAGQALEKGAVKAVIDNPEYKKNDDYILVDNTLEALQQLALYHRKYFKIPFVGITGTNGKTTTKELVSTVLSSHYKTVATQGNLNNHIGVPLTILKVTEETEMAVIEMGANHPGEIRVLCDLALPTHGIITNIGKAHLEGFGSFEGVVKTKKELYDFLSENRGTAFVNGDDELLTKLSQNLERFLYGVAGCEVSGKIVTHFPFLKVEINTGASHFLVSTNLYGSYNLHNILAAAAVGKYFGISDEKIKNAMEDYIPSNNRSQITKTKNNIIIQDAYNANPTSLSKAIDSFNNAGFDNPCLIIGDMFELGKYSIPEHQKIVDMIRDKKFDCVFLVGQDFAQTTNGFLTFRTTDEAESYFRNHLLKGKTILLKGSRGMHLESLIPYL